MSSGARAAGGFALVLACGLAVAAEAARPATLLDLRTGRHPSFTRVVLETDAPAAHRIDTSRADEIVVHVGATGAPRALAAGASPHLSSVVLEPADEGSLVRIRLRRTVALETLILRNPDRIVLDLRDAPEEAVTPAASPEPTPAATPAPAPPADEPAPSESPPPSAEPVPPTGAVEMPELVEGGQAPSWEDLAAVDQAASAAPAPEEGAPTPGPIEPSARPEPAAAPPGAAPTEERAAPPPRRRPTIPSIPPPPPERGWLDRLSGAASPPLVLAALALLAGIALFVVARRRRDEELEDRVASQLPFPEAPAEQDEKPERAEEAVSPEARAPTEPPAPSAFETPAERTEETTTERGVAMDQGTEEMMERAAPEAAVSELAAGPIEELERRIAYLETRLEEVVDAKDRLERHLAAQAEELRVQRAAIARTQRILRGLTRPDAEGTEPVPKG